MTTTHAIQRPLRGSRISTFYPVKSLPSLASLDSAFQLQEYISLLIRLDVHDVEAIVSLPGVEKKESEAKDKENEDVKDGEKSKNEVQVDQACWIYEQLRRLAQDLSHPLITTLQQECTRASCPEMKAGEWLYLCVAHGNDGAMEQCCAIDYILHTVDSATALLNSPRTFPSRLQIPQTSHRHFSSLARRLGRIFAHAYFSHREAFEQAEAESSLYARFLALTSKFELVPAEFLVFPSANPTPASSGYGYSDGRDSPAYAPRAPLHNLQNQNQHGRGLAPKNPQQQTQLGIGRAKSPNPPGLLNLSSSETSPARPSTSSAVSTSAESSGDSATRRIGRNRTDTMVFADAEAAGVVDELAARAKAGEFDEESSPSPSTSALAHPLDVDDDHDDDFSGPKTAKPGSSEADRSQGEDPDEPEDMELEEGGEGTQFEISLEAEEEIPLNAGSSGLEAAKDAEEADETEEEEEEDIEPIEMEIVDSMVYDLGLEGNPTRGETPKEAEDKTKEEANLSEEVAPAESATIVEDIKVAPPAVEVPVAAKEDAPPAEASAPELEPTPAVEPESNAPVAPEAPKETASEVTEEPKEETKASAKAKEETASIPDEPLSPKEEDVTTAKDAHLEGGEAS